MMSMAVAELPPTSAPAITESRPQRLLSLDIFRGITIAAMMLVNNGGHGNAFGPLEHAEWHGWTLTDLIFPFFLFIVGVAIPFSMAKRSRGATKLQLLGGIWFRALSIFLLGTMLHAMPSSAGTLPPGYMNLRILRVVVVIYTVLGIFAILYPWKRSTHWYWIVPVIGIGLWVLMLIIHHANKDALEAGIAPSYNFGGGALTPWKYRIPGVLQRIGVCYGIAATIGLFFTWRGVLIAAVLLCTIYGILMLTVPFPRVEYRGKVNDHVVGSLTQEDNLARRIDEKVFRTHNYSQYPDNEGLLSTLPAIASPLLGICVGYWMRSRRSPSERAAGLLAVGVVVTAIGCLLDWWLMPINKNIWTPSFVVFTAGMGMLCLGAIFWFVDVLGYRRWALPFRIYGMNAIAAFVAAGIIGRIGGVIRFNDPFTDRRVSLLGFFQDRAASLAHYLFGWMNLSNQTMSGMTSLAYAIGFVIFVLLLMSILYKFRVFIKV